MRGLSPSSVGSSPLTSRRQRVIPEPSGRLQSRQTRSYVGGAKLDIGVGGSQSGVDGVTITSKTSGDRVGQVRLVFNY